MGGNRKPGAAPLAALLLLSLLWACEVLRQILAPSAAIHLLPAYERRGLLLFLLSLASGALALRHPVPRRQMVRSSLIVGLGLFVVPTVLIDLSGDWIASPFRTALLTLVPLFTVVFEPYAGAADRPQSCYGYIAALAGFAGALCIFPVLVPASIQAAGAFCAVIFAAASVAAAGCKAVAVAQEIPGSLAAMTALACGIAALTDAVVSVFLEHPILTWQALQPEMLWSIAIELPALALLFWLMGRMSAIRMATRYLLAPLLTVAAGAALLQSSLVWRTWIGLLLMAFSAIWILLAPERAEEATGLGFR